MKKFFFIAAMVSAALISCTKNEPAPSMEAQQEITFMTAPLTKAHSTFGESNHFRTWAYHDQADWSSLSTTAQLYLGGTDGLEIQKIGGVWKNDTQSYYWPKTGKLTFYSYSLNSSATSLTDATVACTNAGITVTNYDIQKNLDVDFLVADQADVLARHHRILVADRAQLERILVHLALHFALADRAVLFFFTDVIEFTSRTLDKAHRPSS